jgi:hypothetical protein
VICDCQINPTQATTLKSVQTADLWESAINRNRVIIVSLLKKSFCDNAMPGSIPELEDLGAKVVDPQALYSLRDEMRLLLHRDRLSFPGAQPVSLLKRHFQDLCNQE